MLSDGKLVEAGHPHKLLSSPPEDLAVATVRRSGYLSSHGVSLASMVDETGPETAERLRRLASMAWEAFGRRGDAGTTAPS